MSASNTFTKDPDAVKDFTVNWASWLATGETITTSAWVVPAGITQDSDSKTDTTATIWLSGGTAGTLYSLANRIVTSASRTEDRVILITVGPAVTSNLYATLPEVKARLGINDTNDDASLERVIEAASRWIESKTGKRFYAATETRVYTATISYFVEIDDLISLASLKTDPAGDGTYTYVWGAADYRLFPYNAALDNKPYTAIEVAQGGAYLFPVYPCNRPGYGPTRPRIQVIGSFGYSAAPPPAIREAAILASMRLWGRKDLVFGISGSAELGTLTAITKLGSDGELQALLSTVKRRVIV